MISKIQNVMNSFRELTRILSKQLQTRVRRSLDVSRSPEACTGLASEELIIRNVMQLASEGPEKTLCDTVIINPTCSGVAVAGSICCPLSLYALLECGNVQ